MSTRELSAAPVALVQVKGPGWGIQLPDGTLYREPHARIQEPHSGQPTVWMTQEQAETEARSISEMLSSWYGAPDAAEQVRVIRLELTDGIWGPPSRDGGYRPADPETGRLSGWRCTSVAELNVEQAHQVMREHKQCAGLIPCRIFGRARGVLCRAGLRTIDTRTRAWDGLNQPRPDTREW